MNCIIVKTANSSVRKIRRKDGSEVQFVEQSVAIENGDDFPQPFRITLDDDQKPYQPGAYQVCPSSFRVGQYGDLQVGRRIKLVPVATPTK